MSDQPSQRQDLQFAAQTAHQLKTPVSAIRMILRLLSGDFAGPMTEKQKELIVRAAGRCDEALESISRMLAIASTSYHEGGAEEVSDIAELARRASLRFASEALKNDISVSCDVGVEPVYVRGHEAALHETICALLDNAMKYTPDFGRVRMTLIVDEQHQRVRLCVADSGTGVPKSERDKVFELFYRSPNAKESASPGTGIGLSFVKAVMRGCGGNVRIETSEFGGAEFVLDFAGVKASAVASRLASSKSNALKVIIVGGVAAGPKAAAKIIRLVPDAEVTVVEKGMLLSYAGCGLPFYVSGVIQDQKELMSTPAGVVRDAVFFQKVKNVRTLNSTEAVTIDRENRQLRVRDLMDETESWLQYDKLLLATGAFAVVPKVPNVDLDGIFTLHGVRDAEGLKAALSGRKARDVVIVGAGLIGVEFTECLVRIGCRVTLVEMRPQILGILDAEMGQLVEQHMESHGVKVLTGTKVESFQGDGQVSAVTTDQGVLPADVVVLASGVRPNTELAREAGLEIGDSGAIRVDAGMRTSDSNIFAAGDCAESTDIVTGKPSYVPLGSTANKQGRVAAINICGGSSTFPGILGTTVCRVFDYCVARTGLSESEARSAGYDVVTALVPGPDKEHFVPAAALLLLKIVVDKKTRRLIGVQAVGPAGADKRIDVAAMAITAKMTVDQIANADLAYAPPYSPAMDNIITAANVAANKLDGHMVGISPQEVYEMMQNREDFVFLDVRSPAEYEEVRLPGAMLVPLGSLRGRLSELPKDKTVIAFCNISLRAYEASLILRTAGFRDARVMDGGIEMWPFEKLT